MLGSVSPREEGKIENDFGWERKWIWSLVSLSTGRLDKDDEVEMRRRGRRGRHGLAVWILFTRIFIVPENR